MVRTAFSNMFYKSITNGEKLRNNDQLNIIARRQLYRLTCSRVRLNTTRYFAIFTFVSILSFISQSHSLTKNIQTFIIVYMVETVK